MTADRYIGDNSDHGRRRAPWRRRGTGMALAVVLGGGALAACGSSASTSSSGTAAAGSSATTASSSSASSSAASYFKGKTITLIAPDKPGGGYDKYARLFAPYLAKALGATVNVENINGGGTLDGTNQMAAAKPNGLTLGLVNVGGDIASHVEHLAGEHFNLTKLSWIGQPAVIPNVMITQPGSSIKSFASMLHSSTPVPVLDVRSGVGDMMNRVVFGAFHIPHKLITGFAQVAALKQGFLAKDGKIAFNSLTSLYPLIAGGQARPLLYSGTVTLASYKKALKGVPSLNTELSKTSLSSAESSGVKEALALSDLADDFAGPPGISASRLAVLRSAFSEAAASGALVARATKQSMQVHPTSGSVLAGEVTTAVSQGSAIGPFVSKG